MNTYLYDRIAVTVAMALETAPEERKSGKLVEAVTHDILEAVRESLPEPVDVEGKWEVESEDPGIHVHITGDKRDDGRQLDYLSKFAADQGYNMAILKMHDDLYNPEEDAILRTLSM